MLPFVGLHLRHFRKNYQRLARPPSRTRWRHGAERLIPTLRRGRLYGRSRFPLDPWRDHQPEKHEHSLIDPQDIRIVQPADTPTNLGFRNRGDFVHHQTARRVQAVALVRRYSQAEQRRLGFIGCEGANRDGVRRVKAIVLHDDDEARLARIVLAAGDGPDVAAPDSSPQSATASMNA